MEIKKQINTFCLPMKWIWKAMAATHSKKIFSSQWKTQFSIYRQVHASNLEKFFCIFSLWFVHGINWLTRLVLQCSCVSLFYCGQTEPEHTFCALTDVNYLFVQVMESKKTVTPPYGNWGLNLANVEHYFLFCGLFLCVELLLSV